MGDETVGAVGEVAEPAGLDIAATVEDIADAMLPREEGEESNEPSEQVAEVAAATEKPEAEKAPGTVDTVQTSTVDAPPDTWRAEAKAAWATVPPVVREELRKREADIKGYYDSVQQPLGVGKKLTEIITPFLPMFNEMKTDPWENIQAMFQIQEKLVKGSPEEKLAIVQGFATQAGIKFENGQLSQLPDAQSEYVKQMRKELDELKGGVTQVTTHVQEARLAELQANIRKFAEDTEAHPYFQDVTDRITQLIKAGAVSNLEEAYQTACAADPVVRQKMVDAQTEKSIAARTKADKERAEKARTAVRTRVRSTNSTGTPQPLGSIDDTLKSALADINSR